MTLQPSRGGSLPKVIQVIFETTHLAAVKAGISTNEVVPEESDGSHMSDISDVSDAQQFIDLMKMANEDGMKTRITEVFQNGGMPRIQAALKIVQAWGYDAKDVELLAAGKEMRSAGLKIKEEQKQTQKESTPSTPSSKSQKATEKTEKKQKFDALEASDEALSLVKSIA